MRLIQVAVPVPQLDALTYAVPPEFPDPHPGARVLVPLGRRRLTGVVLPGSGMREAGAVGRVPVSGYVGPVGDNDVLDSSDSGPRGREPGPQPDPGSPPVTGSPPDPGSRIPDPDTIKSIIDILDDSPFLPPDVVSLALWVADYYACGPGEALAAAMPPRAWVESERHAHITAAGRARLLLERGVRRHLLEALDGDKPVRVEAIVGKAGRYATLLGMERDGLVELTQPLKGSASAYRTVRMATLTAQGHETESAPKLGARQQEAIDLLRGAPAGIDTSELDERGIGAATLKRLATLGLVSFSRRRVERDPFAQGAVTATARAPVILTDEQSNVIPSHRERPRRPRARP